MIAGRGTVAGPGVAPTTAQERYEFLDVLRGLALAGIVLANMASLSMYLYLSEAEKASLRTASTDQLFDFLQLVLIESKFYTIFSVLFGIGFSILMTRADAKGIVFRRFFLRRALYLYLYLIGLAHGVLFWHNDILPVLRHLRSPAAAIRAGDISAGCRYVKGLARQWIQSPMFSAGDAYERFMGRWSCKLAFPFVHFANRPSMNARRAASACQACW